MKNKEIYDQEYDEEYENKKRRIILLIFFLILLLILKILICIFIYRYNLRSAENVKPSDEIRDINVDDNDDGMCDLNCDTNNDGYPDLNIDTDDDKICNYNCDTTGDRIPDKDLLNQDFNNDGVCDLNCDVNGDGYPDYNIDINSDNVCDLRCVTIESDTPENSTPQTPDVPLSPENPTPQTPDAPLSPENPTPQNPDTPDVPQPDDEEKDDTYEGEYIIEFEELTSLADYKVIPGWSGYQSFVIRNNNPKPIVYDLQWVNVENNFTDTNNLYFSLIRNNSRIIKDSRAPYTNQTLKTSEVVAANSENVYKVIYEFKESGINQDIDKNKTFKTNIKVTNIEVSK